MTYRFLPLLLLFFMSFAPKTTTTTTTVTDPTLIASATASNLAAKIELVYNSLDANNYALPQINCFKKAMEGFFVLRQKGIIQKDILTVIDFSLSSTKKRLWVIDLASNTILYNTVVSHGMNSGGEFANNFSNAPSSNKSSLGFYATAETYNGKHGLSLKLDGLENGINSNARARAVVMHGASYANPSILKSQGFLGRSQGCPAIPDAVKNEIIQTIKGKSCLFIYHPSRSYEITSKLVV
ncbi:murein L,D-transpeptidase catalytic domain family protein [Flavobacterium sp.]|uniref:murein L,D-transpeptidase catalytic domain family protein n=1 Tax=Flavobacterium sp. TaxID=239 RepID=UPI0026072EBD|nr:murein L,D-transpeptidase catalytic domain family protein [Flavobacterium sp.]